MIYKNGEIREPTEAEKKEMDEIERRQKEEAEFNPPEPTPEQRLDAVEAETKSVRSDVDALSIIITGKEVSHHGNQ